MNRGFQAYTFVFADAIQRTFYAATYDLALEYARSWGKAHGGLDVVEDTRAAA